MKVLLDSSRSGRGIVGRRPAMVLLAPGVEVDSGLGKAACTQRRENSVLQATGGNLILTSCACNRISRCLRTLAISRCSRTRHTAKNERLSFMRSTKPLRSGVAAV